MFRTFTKYLKRYTDVFFDMLNLYAWVAELVDATDLKPVEQNARVGSIPIPGTIVVC